jgi:cysteine desulfurase/selenocysteine lyase
MSEMTIKEIQSQFPTLGRLVHGKRLAYLDNAATALKPRSVIKAVDDYYEFETANVHRGVHYLSEQATQKYEESRKAIAEFVKARSLKEVIFTPGTTLGINMLRIALEDEFGPGDEIIITELDHHSNIVPWQMLAKRRGCTLKVIPITDDGELVMETYQRLLTKKTRLVALSHISNAIGTVNPIKEITRMAHEVGAWVMVDGAQSACHMPINVQELDCDFFIFSGHKVFGPTGIGILYGKEQILEKLTPPIGGGSMIRTVDMDKSTYADLPARFEAGTPHISGAIGLGAAVRFVEQVGWETIIEQERKVSAYAYERLASLPGVKVIGPVNNHASIFSFVMEGIHPHDVGSIVDESGVAIRVGHHCCQPLMKRLNFPATARASFAFYNDEADVDQLCLGLAKVKEIFG